MTYTSPRFAGCLLAMLIVTFLQISRSNAQISGTIGLLAPPPLFRGKIIYQGTYSGTAVVPAQGGSSIRGGGINVFIPNTTTHELAGAITFELEFNGQAVTGTYRTTGPVRSNSFSGLVNADGCTLTARDGGIFKGLCGTETFSGIAQSPPGARDTVRAQFQSAVTQVVDYGERDRIQAEAASQRQAAAEAARVERERQAVQRVAVASPSASKSGNADNSPRVTQLSNERDRQSARNQQLQAQAETQPASPGTPERPYDRRVRLALQGQVSEMIWLAELKVGQDKLAEAIEWYKKAADLGHRQAAIEIVAIYMGDIRSSTFRPDHQAAWLWVKRVAELGDGPAMFVLGEAYETGKLHRTSTIVVDKDPKLALFWYRKSAALGFSDANERIKELTMTPAQIQARAQDRACIEVTKTWGSAEEGCSRLHDLSCPARGSRTIQVSTGFAYKNICRYKVAVLFKRATTGLDGIAEVFDEEGKEDVLKPGESLQKSSGMFGAQKVPDTVRRVP